MPDPSAVLTVIGVLALVVVVTLYRLWLEVAFQPEAERRVARSTRRGRG
jgi:hypothetical protein